MNINELKLSQLAERQQKLDDIIGRNNKTVPRVNKDLINAKLMAFITELCEFANARRTFKYWSKKAPAPVEEQLEEYVDGLHFLLSINNQLDYHVDETMNIMKIEQGAKHIELMLATVESVIKFAHNMNEKLFQELMANFLSIGIAFKFDASDIYCAYIKKHIINLKRQRDNY